MEHSRAPPEYTTQAKPKEVIAIRSTDWHNRKADYLGNGNRTAGYLYAVEQMIMNNMPPIPKEPK